jgi:peptidoglycan-associated lipoprotein
MKFATKKLFLAVAGSAFALLLAGCPKKPARPDPASTVLGPQGAGTSTGLGTGPSSVDFNPGAPGLVERGNDFDPLGQNRAALEAQTVYFDFDQSAIKASERAKLQAAKEYLDQNPSFRLLAEGHCDWRGTAEYNLGLGDRRAASVKKFLQSLGVPADRIETLSKGSLEAARNADDATMAKDRRVNLVIVNPALAAPGGAPAGGVAPVGAAPRPL